MKTIGLIGGMSWESSAEYYRLINEEVKGRLGGLHSAQCILYSVDFHEIEACQTAGEWEKSGEILVEAAKGLERAGADFIVICTNTMHKMINQIQNAIQIPILHIADATAEILIKNGIRKVALLGTKYTMEQEFYKARLVQKGIEVLIPDAGSIDFINSTIFNELCFGIYSETSKGEYLKIIKGMSSNGAEGIILGCTEIGLLIKQEDTEIPLFDTAFIHASKAALYSLEN